MGTRPEVTRGGGGGGLLKKTAWTTGTMVVIRMKK